MKNLTFAKGHRNPDTLDDTSRRILQVTARGGHNVLNGTGQDQLIFGTDLLGEPITQKKGPLATRFILPPFSVLDARQGDWQERKRAWLSLGIKSEVGRGENLGKQSDSQLRQINDGSAYVDENGRRQTNYKNASTGGSPRPACDYSNRERGDGAGQPIARIDGLTFRSTGYAAEVFASRGGGTSIFDPVLCELMYSWFCAPGGQVVDPFCGGSVRGIVATLLGLEYWGCDLSARQVAANQEQAEVICNGTRPVWEVGDCLERLHDAPDADFVFTCPPYGDLEVYSDDPHDLSTLGWDGFRDALYRVVELCAAKLHRGCFACWVVGDYRDKKTGYYRGFPAELCAIHAMVGMPLYNEAILVTSVGSLPIRVGHFETSKKLGKTHQNVLVFLKP